MVDLRQDHWEGVYAEKSLDDVSWFEATPETSLELVLSGGVPHDVVDVGAGASALVDGLLDAGVEQVTLLDLSSSALAATRARLGDRAAAATTVCGDVLTWAPSTAYDVWHDRAVFHFLTEAADREAYRDRVFSALRPGGLLVVGTFAADGPEQCSGLPTSRYDAAGLAAAFGDGFELVHTRRTEHHTPWGTIQPFTWVVLRAVGIGGDV